MSDALIAGRFKLKKSIGAGTFGEIFEAEDTKTGNAVAVKIEPEEAKYPQLWFENILYGQFCGASCTPQLYWYGYNGKEKVMVMELLGSNLETLLNQCNHKFTPKTVFQLALRMLKCVEYIHSRCFVHRDIKPENFVMGLGDKKSDVFIIDFGLAKKYRDLKTFEHIKFAQNLPIIGTARYSSVNALKGNSQSRRDDLEALGYIWIYFLKGRLPWMGLNPGTGRQNNFEPILKLKEHLSTDELCRGTPDEFKRYLDYSKSLGFAEDPDYPMLYQLMTSGLMRIGASDDGIYDWSLSPSKKQINSVQSVRGIRANKQINHGQQNITMNMADNKKRHYNNDFTSNQEVMSPMFNAPKPAEHNIEHHIVFSPLLEIKNAEKGIKKSCSTGNFPNQIPLPPNFGPRIPIKSKSKHKLDKNNDSPLKPKEKKRKGKK